MTFKNYSPTLRAWIRNHAHGASPGG